MISQELRRGSDRALIHCISFNYNNKWLVVSSDKGTIHVFSLEAEGKYVPADGYVLVT